MVSGRTLMSFRGGSGVGAGPPDSPQAQAPVLSAESVLTQGTLEMLRPIGKDRALGGRGGGLVESVLVSGGCSGWERHTPPCFEDLGLQLSARHLPRPSCPC